MILSLLFLTVLKIHLALNNAAQPSKRSVENVEMKQIIEKYSKTDQLFASDKVTQKLISDLKTLKNIFINITLSTKIIFSFKSKFGDDQHRLFLTIKINN